MGLVLLSLYADSDMENAQKMFDEMCEKDVISWSVIITGYVQNDSVFIFCSTPLVVLFIVIYGISGFVSAWCL